MEFTSALPPTTAQITPQKVKKVTAWQCVPCFSISQEQYNYCLFLQVNLKYGIPDDCSELTCTAGAGTLVLEFGILSKLIGDPKYENVARKALQSLWKYRSNSTGLFGNSPSILFFTNERLFSLRGNIFVRIHFRSDWNCYWL